MSACHYDAAPQHHLLTLQRGAALEDEDAPHAGGGRVALEYAALVLDPREYVLYGTFEADKAAMRSNIEAAEVWIAEAIGRENERQAAAEARRVAALGLHAVNDGHGITVAEPGHAARSSNANADYFEDLLSDSSDGADGAAAVPVPLGHRGARGTAGRTGPTTSHHGLHASAIAAALLAEVRSERRRLTKEYGVLFQAATSGTPSNQPSRVLENFELLPARRVNALPAASARKYRQRARLAVCEALPTAEAFWSQIRRDRFPRLASVLRLVLPVPASSCCAESLFSHASHVLGTRRLSMSDATLSTACMFHYDKWSLVQHLSSLPDDVFEAPPAAADLLPVRRALHPPSTPWSAQHRRSGRPSAPAEPARGSTAATAVPPAPAQHVVAAEAASDSEHLSEVDSPPLAIRVAMQTQCCQVVLGRCPGCPDRPLLAARLPVAALVGHCSLGLWVRAVRLQVLVRLAGGLARRGQRCSSRWPPRRPTPVDHVLCAAATRGTGVWVTFQRPLALL